MNLVSLKNIVDEVFNIEKLCIERNLLICTHLVYLFSHCRALGLAIKHKTHIDTVLAYREQYLQDVGCQETLQQFMQYAGKVLPV